MDFYGYWAGNTQKDKWECNKSKCAHFMHAALVQIQYIVRIGQWPQYLGMQTRLSASSFAEIIANYTS